MKKIFVLSSLVFLATACGSSYEKKGSSNEGGDGGLSEAKQQQWVTTIKPIVDASCAMSGCHATAGFVKTPEAFLASSSKARILKQGSGQMPVPGTAGDKAFSAAAKASVLAFYD